MLKQYRIWGSLDKNKFTKLILAHVIREYTSLYYLCAYLQWEKGSPTYATSTGISKHQMSCRQEDTGWAKPVWLNFYSSICLFEPCSTRQNNSSSRWMLGPKFSLFHYHNENSLCKLRNHFEIRLSKTKTLILHSSIQLPPTTKANVYYWATYSLFFLWHFSEKLLTYSHLERSRL